MKKFFKYSLQTLLLVAAFSFNACQEAFEELPQPDEQQTINASSSTAKLIENTASYDGSFDNIVDGASCFALEFPYSVRANGVEITIESKEGLHLIEEIFDELVDDEDFLEIIFPIVITLADFTEVEIAGIDDLRELAAQCVEGGEDDDIECIDFVYPITIYTFDINEVETGSVTVESDKDLRTFFAGLDDNDLIGIDFPVAMELYDGTKIEVRSNAELANAIEMAKEACDEDDDDDYNDDDFTQERLENLLVECPWLIHEVIRDEVNQSDQYFEYVMNFTEDGGVTVKDRMGNSLMGGWSTRVTDHGILLNLEFDVLVDFNLEWFVYEIGEGKIKLYAEGGNRIIMHSVCDLFDTDPNTLREILKECNWVIKKVIKDGQEIDRLLGYEFNFLPEGLPLGTVTLSNGQNTSEGLWEITTNEQGRLVMAIDMPSEEGVYFEWPLSDLRNDRLKFKVEEIGYELVLQRVCDDNANDGDVAEIRTFMMQGDWVVAEYVDGEIDKTDNYVGYTFDFMANNLINTTSSEMGVSYPGLWRVLRNSDGKLKVYLNFGEVDILDELTEDWVFDSITDNKIILKDVSDDPGTMEKVSTLIFQRIPTTP
ncbi:hypothetical protein [uncultured Eudoraea sp.]|uniref:hypothetical protein n=1 Tax=uncultured Eudoraea sp. TaxID=1035614 RepID=UPI00262B7543|nr:hypothetical protein [uncultured Eudoraea sp.]